MTVDDRKDPSTVRESCAPAMPAESLDISVDNDGWDEEKTVPTGNMSSAIPQDELNRLTDDMITAIKSVYDPEIPVNIYDLGLIYGVEITDESDALVTMTLTTPHCPVAETMPAEVELRAASVPGVRDAEVNLVWDPPWGPDKMTDEARLELGML